MQTLIINGSPHKTGDTMTLVNELNKHLLGEKRIIHTYYDKISPCLDCRYCWQNPSCAINDGMQEIYRLFNEVNNVIIASPLYFSNLTGELLSFASRLQLFYVSRRIRKDPTFSLKKKNGAIILAGGGDRITEPAITTANYILGQLNTKSVETILSLHTNDYPAKEDVGALGQARDIALRLNELSESQMS